MTGLTSPMPVVIEVSAEGADRSIRTVTQDTKRRLKADRTTAIKRNCVLAGEWDVAVYGP